MSKIWSGRLKDTAESVDEINSSIRIDSVMYKEDITGSIAYAEMLGKQNIISKTEAGDLVLALKELCADIESGKTQIDYSSEDIHTFVESNLTEKLGAAGKKIHTGRSRNDQVATDTRLYLIKKTAEIRAGIKNLLEVLLDKATKYKDSIMPGYTHLQRAQPVTFGYYMAAYSAMLMRDDGRLQDLTKRLKVLPLGSGALAGTTYDTDRFFLSDKLGFSEPCFNAMDGVSDRDFCIELNSAIAIIMMHLSRFSEEIIMWCSTEFKFIEIEDSYATGSSIMPQKKNPDVAELVRGKTGRVYGNLMTMLTVMKALPLAYNKDMQEDKEAVFDSVDTVLLSLKVFAEMLSCIKVNTAEMLAAAEYGFINATDCADYLAKKGMPFRDAYKITGNIVRYCSENKTALKELGLDKYKEFSELFDEDIYSAIDMENCLAGRKSYGGPGAMDAQIKVIKDYIGKNYEKD